MAVTATFAQAAPITLHFTGNGVGNVGLDGLAGYWVQFNAAGAVKVVDLTFKSGPLIDVTEGFACGPSDCPTTTYRYHDGTLEVLFEWLNPDASISTGTFTAPLINLVSVVDETDTGGGEGRHSVDEFDLGPGIFDAPLASRLGVNPHTDGGIMSFYLELIDGDPLSAERLGDLNEPFLDIYARVPEPGLTALLMGGLTALAVKRRYR